MAFTIAEINVANPTFIKLSSTNNMKLLKTVLKNPKTINLIKYLLFKCLLNLKTFFKFIYSTLIRRLI